MENKTYTAEIGVVVPVYKVKREYLDQCVSSLVNQTYRNIQVILVDDGSPDDCGRWCDELAGTDPRVKSVHHECNKGLPTARNTGMSLLNTRWVTFVDSDDWLDLNAFEILMNFIQQNKETPQMLIFTGYRNYINSEEASTAVFDDRKWFLSKDEIEELQIKSFSFTQKDYPSGAMNLDSACWRLVSMDFIRKNNIKFIDVPYREDGLFFLYTTELADSIAYLYAPLYHYRDTGNSMVNNYRPNADCEHEQYLNEVWSFIDKFNKSKRFREQAYYAVLISMQICITQKFFNKQNKSKFSDKYKECARYFSKEPFRTALRKIKQKNLKTNFKIKYILIKCHMYFLLPLMRDAYNRLGKRESFN